MAQIGLSSWCQKHDSTTTTTSGRGRGGAVAAVNTGRQCHSGCSGIGRLIRKLKKQSKMLCMATKPGVAAFDFHYDPLSYARNFDHNGLDDDSSHFFYAFSSKFVTAAKQPLVQGNITR